MQIQAESMVSMVHSFLYVVDHTCIIEKICRGALGGSYKRTRQQGSYSRPQFRGRDSYDGPRQQFQ